MAVSVRQRKHVLGIMYKDFKKYKMPADVEFYKYLETADNPVGMPAIRKYFKKWGMALRQLESLYPDVYKHEEAPKVEPKVKTKVAPKKVESDDK